MACKSVVWVARGDSAHAGFAVSGTERVYVAVGGNFPDSLSAGPVAAMTGAPILLVPTNPPIPGRSPTSWSG